METFQETSFHTQKFFTRPTAMPKAWNTIFIRLTALGAYLIFGP